MRLRIAADGTVRGLWDDAVEWSALGRVGVERVSHVEFCPRRQQWYVRSARPSGWLRSALQRLLSRPCAKVLFMANTRGAALAWEREHFGPGGPGWPPN